jgi:hypothetical protein
LRIEKPVSPAGNPNLDRPARSLVTVLTIAVKSLKNFAEKYEDRNAYADAPILAIVIHDVMCG